jgi:hypothetical protein
MAIKTFTTGEVLTASDTNTYLANSGLVYINQFTLSGATTNLTSIFTSTYDNYRVIVSGVTTASAVECTFQMLNATTPVTGANYNSVRWSSTTGVAASTGQTSGRVIVAGTTTQSAIFEVFNPALAVKTNITSSYQYGANADQAWPEMVGAVHTLATAYDGMSIIAPGTTFTAGKVTVYGYRKP